LMQDRRARNGSQKAAMVNFPEHANSFDRHINFIIG
jgi:hypothetical protein